MVFAENASKRRRSRSNSGSTSRSSSSQDNQLFLAPLAVRSSKVQRGVERPTSPHAAGPAAKRARMNVDCNVHYSGSRSVAQRLKQCSLKDLNAATSNGNVAFKTPSLPGCRPSPKLTPKQHNTVRIIAQYLRDLGLKESLDALTEESGCKVENANARKLREAIYKAKWDDATAVLEKCYANLKPHQLETAKLIILEEKFYDLLHSDNVGRWTFCFSSLLKRVLSFLYIVCYRDFSTFDILHLPGA
ncbi:hypothetical protein OESDEN_00214 [Oesophagostomum dentatum]|uniref:Uncharacterized protein n=1 Tax=Oesophagostomum dentatum TaxID=61180 RepID=A0A0B1TQJ0_OESDE|nr:hypothetical protein OESDEN_00214 [Oesophagostomum dentatum]